MKKYLSIIAITSFVFVATVALAEDVNTTNSDRPLMKERPLVDLKMKDNLKRPPMTPEIQAAREAFVAELVEDREALKEGLITKEEFRSRVLEQQETFRAELKTKLEAFKEEVKAKKEEFKNSSEEVREKFRENVQNMIGQRFESAFANLERMQERVASLAEKLESDGKDTGDAEKYLDDSKDKLADAKAKLAEIKELLPAEGEEVSAEVFEKIKVGARETKDLIKESHSSLVQAIKELKGLGEDGEESGESEDENESE